MEFTKRKYAGEDDYWQIRIFLRECFLLNGRREDCWQPAILDYWRWHINRNCFEREIDDQIWLWENREKRISAVLHSAGKRDAILDIHPQYKCWELEQEMLETALDKLSEKLENGSRKIYVWSQRKDALRNQLLTDFGFERQAIQSRQRYFPLIDKIAESKLPADYKIRAVGGIEELPARSWASWTAFHPDEPDEKYEGWEWYLNVQKAPLYRRDLDLVVEAPDGTIAGFATVWLDDHTRTAVFEPVGVDINHQRRGIGKALLLEGLRRSAEMGATLATVISDEEPAHTFYESAGFTDYDICDAWLKIW
ncbi:MAG: GNAT family N-acetyltransferase [Candidatus Cloacimonetes bacterium]|nr:GNAT family N-acetyltransferase [Candidatus Cloacimonadota bacterium]